MKKNSNLIPLFIGAVLVLAMGLYNIITLFNSSYDGFSYNKDYIITNVQPNSPAEKAGMLKGDQIKTCNGKIIDNTNSFIPLEDSEIGENIEFTIERNGEERTLLVHLESQPVKEILFAIGIFILSLAFLSSGVFTHYKVESELSLIFALFSLVVGFLFSTQMHIQNNVLVTIYLICYFLLPSLLMHFLLIYPHKSSFLDRKFKWILLYIPSAAISIIYLVFYFLNLDVTNNPLQYTLEVFYFGYLIAALVLGLVKYFRANADFRKKSGLNLIVLATVIGVAILILGGLFMKGIVFISVIVPVLMSIATIKQAQIELNSNK